MLTDEQRGELYEFFRAQLAVVPIADHVESLLAQARAEERARCKGLCYQMAAQFPSTPTVRSMAEEIAENIACGATELGRPAIRARKDAPCEH